MTADQPEGVRPRRVLVLGATGTIGRATVRALVSRGHEVVCLVRRPADTAIPAGATARIVDLADTVSLARDGVRGEPFDVLVSCLASRTGLPDDAWAIDYGAQVNALHAGRAAGVQQVVLLSAICVQKPILAFQHAKLAFEAELIASGLDYTIVRPTAFFKSLSGQIDRVRRGKPFLVFGDGTLTACKPISDDDLGALSRGLPRRRGPAQSRAADRRAGRGDHAARAGRAAVRPAGTRTALHARAGGAAGRDRRRSGDDRADGCRPWPPRPNSRGSGATTRPNPCSCWTRRPGDTMRKPPRRRDRRRCSTTTRAWSVARRSPSVATTPCSDDARIQMTPADAATFRSGWRLCESAVRCVGTEL